MEPIPEVERLRAEIQLRHLDHVRIEIELGITFLELARVECQNRDEEAGAMSLQHAHQAVDGARKGMTRITSIEIQQRALIEAQIRELEAAIEQFENSK